MKLSLDEANITMYDAEGSPPPAPSGQPPRLRLEQWAAQAGAVVTVTRSHGTHPLDPDAYFGTIYIRETQVAIDGPRLSAEMVYEGLVARLEDAGEVIP